MTSYFDLKQTAMPLFKRRANGHPAPPLLKPQVNPTVVIHRTQNSKESRPFLITFQFLPNFWPFIEVMLYQNSYQSEIIHFEKSEFQDASIPTFQHCEGPL